MAVCSAEIMPLLSGMCSAIVFLALAESMCCYAPRDSLPDGISYSLTVLIVTLSLCVVIGRSAGAIRRVAVQCAVRVRSLLGLHGCAGHEQSSRKRQRKC